MKNWKNILLTIAAVLLLILFGWLVTSPSITEDAADRHMNLDNSFETEEDSGDDAYNFL